MATRGKAAKKSEPANGAHFGFEAKLWRAADKLRGAH
jgi:hypothetical protein